MQLFYKAQAEILNYQTSENYILLTYVFMFFRVIKISKQLENELFCNLNYDDKEINKDEQDESVRKCTIHLDDYVQ